VCRKKWEKFETRCAQTTNLSYPFSATHNRLRLQRLKINGEVKDNMIAVRGLDEDTQKICSAVTSPFPFCWGRLGWGCGGQNKDSDNFKHSTPIPTFPLPGGRS
jgi:hypothetical protein